MPVAKYSKNKIVIFTGHHDNYPSKFRSILTSQDAPSLDSVL